MTANRLVLLYFLTILPSLITAYILEGLVALAVSISILIQNAPPEAITKALGASLHGLERDLIWLAQIFIQGGFALWV